MHSRFSLRAAIVAPLLLLATFAADPARPFHAAAKAGDLAALDRALATAPADLDRPDPAGNTPVMLAAQEGHVEVVRSLLTRGANASHADLAGFTPLINAVRPPAALDRSSQTWSDTLLTVLFEVSRPKSDAPVIVSDGNAADPRPQGAKATQIRSELAAMFPQLPADLLQRKARIVELLLAAGASPKPSTPKTRGPLHFAAALGGEELLAPLLRAGADPNLPAPITAEMPLHVAAFAGNAAAASFLLARGADPDALSGALVPDTGGMSPGSGGNTPVMSAILLGRTELIRVLLDGGAKVETANRTFNRALHFAASMPDPAVARLLLDRGARTSVRDRWQCTPLNYAASKGHLAVVQLLVERGADLESADEAGYTPLLDAIEKNRLDVVQFLAAKGASFRARTHYGKTPLRVAATGKYLEMTRYLLAERREQADGEPDDKQPPLYEAVGSGSPKVAALLLEHGANPNRLDSGGNSALHAAIVCRPSVHAQWLRDRGARTLGSTSSTFGATIAGADADYDEIIRLLCSRGAKPDALDLQGETPLHLAARYGALSAAKQLLELGAARDVPNRSGHTALELAVERGHVEVVTLLGGNPELVVRRGPTARERLSAMNRRIAGDLPAAAETSTSELNAGLIAALTQSARAKFDRSDHAAAIIDYDRILTLDPRNVNALAGRGMARTILNQRDAALADLDQAVALAPDQSGLLMQRGTVRGVFGLTDLALADLDRSIALDATKAGTFTLRARARAAKADHAGALSDLTRALELSPDDFETLVSRADLHRIQRDYDRAIADYTAALRIDPNHATVLLRRAISRESKNDHRGAIPDFDRAIELNPKSAEAFNGRGFSRQALGQYPAALADLNRAIELSPRFAAPFHNRGLVHRAQGDYAAALADFDTALKLSPTLSSALNNRAITRHIQGDHAAAIADYDSYIKASPNVAYPRIYRFLCQRRLGQTPSATDLSTATEAKAASWTKSLARYLAGEIAADALLALAAQGTGGTANTRPCEAHYAIGITELAAGRTAEARAHFEKSIAKELPAFASFHFARAELARLKLP